jgi:hypothetical protein
VARHVRLGGISFVKHSRYNRECTPDFVRTAAKEELTMNLVLELPPELETELAAEAARLGLPLAEYALRLLAGRRGPSPPLRNGAELLAYWQGEGLVGTRPEVADSAAHARDLREKAQRRARP